MEEGKMEGRRGRTFLRVEMDESRASFPRSSQSSGGERERWLHRAFSVKVKGKNNLMVEAPRKA